MRLLFVGFRLSKIRAGVVSFPGRKPLFAKTLEETMRHVAGRGRMSARSGAADLDSIFKPAK